MLAMAGALLWHVSVKPIKGTTVWFGGAAVLMLFTVSGYFRDTGSAAALAFRGLGEFDVIWSNAIHLFREANNFNLQLPLTTQFNSEVFGPIPSQFLWFNKSSLSIWYMETYWPYFQSKGGGYGFGSLTQIIVGGGVLEGVVRGFLGGAISIWLLNLTRKASVKWWYVVLFLFLYMTIFQSNRVDQFYQWTSVTQLWAPAIVFLMMLNDFITPKNRTRGLSFSNRVTLNW